MNTRFIKNIALAGVITVTAAACDHSLDITPKYDVVSEKVYQDFNNYKPILAKLYAGYAVTGQQGPAGRPDIGGIDEGFSNYLRQYWQSQELTTDEAIIGWNDGNLRDLHDMDWTANNEFLRALYDRIFYQISLTNEFIRETKDEGTLTGRGITGANLEEAKRFNAEARFLRALSYWHALDLYGNVPFVTDNDKVGFFLPQQTTRQELFNYVESELLAIENLLVPARQNEYGRADQAAAWTLLTKLYLNAEVYTGQARYDKAMVYAEKVINAGYTLETNYDNLFKADNHKSQEIIFAINFDGTRTTTWGGMTYLVHAPVGGSMNAAEFGINGGWGGLRTTKSIVNLFDNRDGGPDNRANFYTQGQQLEINDIFTFTDGFAIAKYRNVTSTDQTGSDPSGNHPDTDFPMFRLADVYLMYAEAALRANGDRSKALDYVNRVRDRAYLDPANGNITQSQLTLDFILNERARELHWEAHRRTDLIRFGRYTGGNYVWPWKGAVKDGRGVEDFRTLFPIPTTDLTANPNLKQNTGY